MCLESLRIGRRKSYAASLVQANGSVQQLCAPNSKRVGLTISWGVPLGAIQFFGAAYVAPKQIDLTSAQGLMLTGSTPILKLYIEKDGLVITDQWNCIDANAFGGWFAVIEEFFEDDAKEQYVLPNSTFN